MPAQSCNDGPKQTPRLPRNMTSATQFQSFFTSFPAPSFFALWLNMCMYSIEKSGRYTASTTCNGGGGCVGR